MTTDDDTLTYVPQEPGEIFVVDINPLRTRRYAILRTYEDHPLNVALPDKTALLYLKVITTWHETCYVFLVFKFFPRIFLKHGIPFAQKLPPRFSRIL